MNNLMAFFYLLAVLACLAFPFALAYFIYWLVTKDKRSVRQFYDSMKYEIKEELRQEIKQEISQELAFYKNEKVGE